MSFKDSSYSALKVRRQKQKQITKISICILFKVTHFSSMGQILFKIKDLFEHLVTSVAYEKQNMCIVDLFPFFFICEIKNKV